MTFPFAMFCPGNSKPGPFAFDDVVNVPVGELCYSNTITPAGYDSAALVTPVGCEYCIDGGQWTSLSTYIVPGQSIAIRATAPATWSSSRQVALSIDTTTAVWKLSTASVTGGQWDTGWTTGAWTAYTPKFFDWFRVQLWAPGGGGGGMGGIDNSAWGTPGSPGGTGGNAQFAGGPYATGGGGGGGGGAGVMFNNGSGYWGADGAVGSPGTWGNGDSGTNGGGAGGGAGPSYPKNQYPSGGNGGNGGAGGYCIKTYYWGQIAPVTPCSAYVQAPGAGGEGGRMPSQYYTYPGGAAGGYGRIYCDWG